MRIGLIFLTLLLPAIALAQQPAPEGKEKPAEPPTPKETPDSVPEEERGPSASKTPFHIVLGPKDAFPESDFAHCFTGDLHRIL